MATPNRLKTNRLKSALSPLAKIARVITPTGIGVLLSVGAHAALITAGPRLNVSFDALTKEDLEANPEETIVPILELSAAERNRLPSFAQPRRPPSSTGLSSLQLPSGLPSFPSSSRSIKRRPVPAQPIPAPSTSRPSPLGQTLPSRPQQATPFKLDLPVRLPSASPPAPSTTFIPQAPAIPSVTANSGEGARPITFDENGLPILNSPVSNNAEANTLNESNPSSDVPQSGGTSISEALAGTRGAGIAINPADDGVSAETDGPNESGETSIRIEDSPAEIAVAPAEGDPSQLLKGNNVYSATGTSDADAEENLTEWLASSASGKGQVEAKEAEITIDSGFKACRAIAPVNGLIGVLVNPDGSKESVETLKSTGYGSLNSLALTTLEYEDFGQPEVPTQYQVEVQVTYEPEDCVEDLPEEPADGAE